MTSELPPQQPATAFVAFAAYAVAWTTLGCVTMALYRHAWTLRDALALDREERVRLRGSIAAQAMIPATGLLALAVIAVSMLADVPGLAAVSGFAYALMSLTGVVVSRARRRARCELDAGTGR